MQTWIFHANRFFVQKLRLSVLVKSRLPRSRQPLARVVLISCRSARRKGDKETPVSLSDERYAIRWRRKLSHSHTACETQRCHQLTAASETYEDSSRLMMMLVQWPIFSETHAYLVHQS